MGGKSTPNWSFGRAKACGVSHQGTSLGWREQWFAGWGFHGNSKRVDSFFYVQYVWVWAGSKVWHISPSQSVSH